MKFKKGLNEFVLLIAQKISQPIGDLFITSIDWETLNHCKQVDKRILAGFDDDGSEVYRGIQRDLSKERKEELIEYVNRNSEATFPTSIIVNIPFEKLRIEPLRDSLPVSLDEDQGNFEFKVNIELYALIFPWETEIIQIIDGQHRLSGFSNSSNLKFDLPVTVFVDQGIESQAEIFAIVNGKQTRVSPSLVYELFGLSTKRNPYSIAHNVAILLNEDKSSPFFRWIMRLGKANDFYKGFITQSTVIKSILELICGNIKQAEIDKNRMAKGQTLSELPEATSMVAPLRKFFLTEEDTVIFKVISNFFSAVKETFPVEWEKDDSIFKRTIGYLGLIKVFKKLALRGIQTKKLSKEFFLFEIMKYKDVTFNNIQLSSKGVNQVYEKLTS